MGSEMCIRDSSRMEATEELSEYYSSHSREEDEKQKLAFQWQVDIGDLLVLIHRWHTRDVVEETWKISKLFTATRQPLRIEWQHRVANCIGRTMMTNHRATSAGDTLVHYTLGIARHILFDCTADIKAKFLGNRLRRI